MRVAKWGNSLAVRLPRVVVEALDLRDGDNVEINIVGTRSLEFAKSPGAQDLLARLRDLGAGQRRDDAARDGLADAEWVARLEDIAAEVLEEIERPGRRLLFPGLARGTKG